MEDLTAEKTVGAATKVSRGLVFMYGDTMKLPTTWENNRTHSNTLSTSVNSSTRDYRGNAVAFTVDASASIVEN